MKSNSTVAKDSKEQKVFDLFKQYLINKKAPVKMQEFIDEKTEELKQFYSSMGSIKNFFRKWQENGIIQVVHYKEFPTPVILTKQEFITSDLQVNYEERNWITIEEKQKLREQFEQKVISNPNRTFSQEAISYVGSYSSKKENMNLCCWLFEKVFQITKQPMTTKEITEFLVNKEENPEVFDIVLSNMRLAKSQGCFQDVYLKGEKKRSGYNVPSFAKKIEAEKRDWLYASEWKNTVKKELEKESAEKRKTSENEPQTYQFLLDDKEYGLYLFTKLLRTTWFPKKELIEIKLEDYDPEKQTITVHFSESIIESFSRVIQLDELTNAILQLWLQERSTYTTAESPYLFVTKKISKIEKVNNYLERFRKYAKKAGFVLHMHYYDRTHSDRYDLYYRGDKPFILEDKLKTLNLEWYTDLEKPYKKFIQETSEPKE